MRLAIITTHPIQYNAPLFQLLQKRGKITAKVFYTWGTAATEEKYDPGFGKSIQWDIPLLKGYEYSLVENTSSSPGSHHFWGIKNPTLIKDVKDWKAEAILVYGWNFESHLQCLRVFRGKIPVFFRGDSTLVDEQNGLKKFFRRVLLTWVYRHIDIAFFVGANNRDYFLLHGLKERQLVFAPHAIDNERFGQEIDNSSKRSLAWRRDIGINDNDLVILYAGKLEAKKNPFFLVELSEMISCDHVKFLVVGNGALEGLLKQATKCNKKFIFLGFQNQSQMPMVYGMGDIFILPSRGPGETWGLALNEAMACGMPVMASSKVGGAIDLIKEELNGIIFNPDDTEKPKQYIEKLATDKAALKRAGAASREQIKNFNFTALAQAIEDTCLKAGR